MVVAFAETHGRPQTAALIDGLEVIPRKKLAYRGSEWEEMDVDAVLARKPQIALVDELAHTNVPGSRHEKRWQDVAELLDAGIDVISAVNVQHLESVTDVVEQITGVPQRETVPDAVVRAADQVELVDMTAEALRRRMAHGNIYPPEKIDAALTNYFRAGNLTALRELALLWLADKVDEGLQRYRAEHDISATWEARERVVVALTGGPEGDTLIRRAARVAARAAGGDLLAVHVTKSDGLTGADPANLARQRQLVESLGGTYHQVVGDEIAEALLTFARAENATQLVLGASRRGWLLALLTGPGIGARTIRGSGPIDVHIVTHSQAGRRRWGILPRYRGGITRQRQVIGWVLAAALAPLVTLALASSRTEHQPDQRRARLPGRGDRGRAGRRVPARRGRGRRRVAAAELLLHPADPPVHHRRGQQRARAGGLRRGRPGGQLGGGHHRPADQAGGPRQRRVRAAGDHGGLHPARPGHARRAARAGPGGVRHALGQPARAARPGRAGPGHGPDWAVVACSGDAPAARPDDADVDVPVSDTLTLALAGRPLPAADRRVLGAFAAYAGIALEQQRLAAEAEAAKPIAAADRMRTALLAAVSHDLRTPLASAKAAVTSLRSRDMQWDEADTEELLATADESLDRLTRLVGNLLDMSRLQAGRAVAVPPAGRAGRDHRHGPRRPGAGRPRHHGGDPRDAARGPGRPGHPGAGHRQPGRERAALLARGQAAADRRVRARRPGRAAGRRPGPGHPGKRPRADVRPLPAAGRHGQHHRGRPRAGAVARADRGDGGHADRGGHPRRRTDDDGQPPGGARMPSTGVSAARGPRRRRSVPAGPGPEILPTGRNGR